MGQDGGLGLHGGLGGALTGSGEPGALIPAGLRATVAGRPADGSGVSGDEWLRLLPAVVAGHLDRWALRPDGPARHGECALVLPVRSDRGPAALKVTWPHEEARTEHLALRLWGGTGAVRLLAADPAGFALLLERLDPGRELTGVSVLEACEVVGGLFRTLDRPATAQFPALSSLSAHWRERLDRGSAQVPRRLTEQAASTLAELLGSGVDGRLVHTDLHDANVLAPLDAARGDWLAIDPKPVSGEWAHAVAPMVWNRQAATAAAANPRQHVRLRADLIADAAGLDADRVVAWTLVRLVLNAVWAADHGAGADAFGTRMIALAKAFLE